jgi:predicted DNA-binding protein YlxM (UPF0122 family)
MKDKLQGKKAEVIAYYQDNHSLPETAAYFGVGTSTVHRVLVKCGVVRRSRSEALKLHCDEQWRQQHGEKLRGKPSGASGKQWTFDRPIHRPNLRGEKNPAWRGGIVGLSKAIRDIPEYRLWRDAVFTRDNYTCLHCGARSGVDTKVILNVEMPSRLLCNHEL